MAQAGGGIALTVRKAMKPSATQKAAHPPSIAGGGTSAKSTCVRGQNAVSNLFSNLLACEEDGGGSSHPDGSSSVLVCNV
eukprot:4790278-Pleurochrysis_carterae.AAC.1